MMKGLIPFDALIIKSVIAPAYKNWCEQDFIDYLKRFSLNPKQKINTLSKGMRMKFALALALSHKAELLVMDEPTSGLDPLVRSQLLDILKDYMCNGGKGVFFSTHITSDLDKIADMLIMIDDGQIVFQEEKDQLLDSYRIIKGSTEKLNENTRRMFLNIEESTFGFVIIIMASPVLSAFLLKSGNGIQLDFLDTVSTTAIIIFCILVSLVVFAISAILSIKFLKSLLLKGQPPRRRADKHVNFNLTVYRLCSFIQHMQGCLLEHE